MKLITKLLCTAGVALSMMGAAHAETILNNWSFNPTGTGPVGAMPVTESLDVTGAGFIDLTVTGANTFNFVEHAVFKILSGDNGTNEIDSYWNDQRVTATFEAAGQGTFNGGFIFTSGKIRMYTTNAAVAPYGTSAGFYGANVGTMIAEFDVLVGGGGLVNPDGSPVNNGQVTVHAKASAGAGLMPGVFFRNGNIDLTNEDVLSFAFTNANTILLPTDMQVSEIICQYSGYVAQGCTAATYSNTPNDHFLVGNNGQFKLASVPEPTSIALFGIALLGAGVVSRKRAANKA
jgi:hypothetical protein